MNLLRKLRAAMPSEGAGSDIDLWEKKAKELQSLIGSGVKDIGDLVE
jgi:hypothetical protein